MPIIFDIEKDTLYKKGFEKGFKEGFKKGFKEGIKKRAAQKETQAIIGAYEFGIKPTEIAQALNISTEKVDQVIAEWKDKV